jgi:hypothetical protein
VAGPAACDRTARLLSPAVGPRREGGIFYPHQGRKLCPTQAAALKFIKELFPSRCWCLPTTHLVHFDYRIFFALQQSCHSSTL